ncbi:helix-turn-helix domain-containing protein [Paenibacillus flagellatus]|uniref:AraC family transcriptional regulator n=1 Tax=Paenibacillus flagellatus TaxID=2211139 RepID=A0A2V5KR27_9BACL|nr:AraC family transcriptional regulator [Paenibacillus flagellatus]PYI53817.1 AraC family transcriptional regulator [Paenibacillus flagellatus]
MPSYHPQELLPHVVTLVDWRDKARFEKDEDQSPLWVLFAVESGSFRFELEKHRGNAEKGSLVLCPPNTVLKRVMLRPSSFLVLYFTWRSETGEEIRGDELLQPNPTGLSVMTDKQRFASNCGYLRLLKSRMDAPSVARRNFLLQDLWHQYGWECETSRRRTTPVYDDPLMDEARTILTESACHPLGLGQLSDRLGLSTVQLSRRFRRKFGVNPSEFVSELRLDKACALLAETGLTLDAIAAECGYANGYYLSRVFSQKMGISPSEYRKAHRI